MQKDADCLSRFRDTLENALLQLEETYVNGSKEYRLPHVSNISFKYAESEGLLMGLNKEIALSSGSACTSASIEPSYVLKALGLSNEMAHSSLRFSLGRYTTEEEVDYTVDQMVKAVKQLREMSPLWEMYKASVI
jgi:cysteine desulfurase